MNIKEEIITIIGLIIIIMIIVIAIQFEKSSVNKCISSGHSIEFCENIK